MDNLYNSGKLCRSIYAEKKRLHGVDRVYGQGVPEDIIHQEAKSKKKQDKVRGEVKVVVMKGDTTCPYFLHDTNPLHIISTVAENFKWTPIKKKVYI